MWGGINYMMCYKSISYNCFYLYVHAVYIYMVAIPTQQGQWINEANYRNTSAWLLTTLLLEQAILAHHQEGNTSGSIYLELPVRNRKAGSGLEVLLIVSYCPFKESLSAQSEAVRHSKLAHLAWTSAFVASWIGYEYLTIPRSAIWAD